MNGATIYKQNIKYRIRKVSNRYVLLGAEKCFEFNELANFIWEHINGDTDINAIVEAIIKDYECTRQVAEKDVNELIKFLADNGILKEVV